MTHRPDFRASSTALLLAMAAIAGCLIPETRMSSTAAGASEGSEGSDHNLLANGTFDDGTSLPWTSSFTDPGNGEAKVKDGALCLEVTNAGKNRWDAQLRIREMVIERGHEYRVHFRAWADKPTRARPKVGMAGPPYGEYWADTIELTSEPQQFSAAFAMSQADDPTAELAFHVGAELAMSSVPYTLCIDDVVLEDPAFVRKANVAVAAAPNVLVNQLGYLPDAQKLATWKSGSGAPAAWTLFDASGKSVAEGQTRTFGNDPASGDEVQIIDFSQFDGEGEGFTLRVGEDESHRFAIAKNLYARLRNDAIAFFYHQRSGVEIKMPYAGSPQFARPAGHTDDRAVGCSSGCDYELDASGGWYDAGDHGKYVVNGGISVFTLLNLYERSVAAKADAPFADGKLRLPEAGNGVPDLLDEARFELEFLLKMQVPKGPLAGMVHHKLHGKKWTELGTAPEDDDTERFVWPPSTAATLNLAAVAAQAARLWAKFDPAFSKRCLAASKRAFDAALAHPAVYAPLTSGPGGGPYGDNDVRDEFYWAAAELLVTTGEPKYRQQLERSPLNGSLADEAGPATLMTWDHVAAAGLMSLALAPASLGPERDRARAAIVALADAYAKAAAREGYGLPYAPGGDGKYPWGSNSFVLNNAIALGLAFDFTGERKYRDGVVAAMDYVLGRNPLDQSYVTGYGARPLEHPHHRFFAQQVRSDRPPPPPGLVSGGPNSDVQDPYAKAAGLAGKPAQKCFIDHIEAWSTNEVTINWNAPLAWVAAFLGP